MNEDAKKYRKDGDKIYRIEDEKHVADIKDGEVVPTAPAYYKIKETLEEIATVPERHSSDEQPDIEDEQPDADEVADMIEEVNHGGIVELTPDEADKYIEELNEQNGGGLTYAKIKELYEMLQKGEEKPSKGDPMPTPNPALGDRDPSFIAWLVRNNPEEAASRYAGKDIETYELAVN